MTPDRHTVYAVLPGNVHDPGAPSGGNTYDRRVCQALAGAGWSVREIAVPGTWPQPTPADRAALAAALATVPDRAVVLLDGLVACPAPDVVVPEAARLRPVVLVHLPLADETGLAPQAAGDLHARERQVLRAADAVVATSGQAAHRLVERHRLPPDRMHVAPPGVDRAPLASGTDGVCRLLCVAAVTPRKGHDLLVEALTNVADRRWECVCVGDLDRAPGHVARIRRMVRAFGFDGRVRLVGVRTGEDLAASYAAADLLVLASRAETYGMVVTEALARGVPVLATDTGGVAEALGRAPDGIRPGVLVPPDDPAALAAGLRHWFDDPGWRRELHRAAAARRDTLSGWQATAATLGAVLADLVPAAGRSG
jgi:glycosyltransferase involved in cell wall biosynthesis